MSEEPTVLNYREAVHLGVDYFSELESQSGMNLSELTSLDFNDLFIQCHPGIETHYTESGGVYHTLDEDLAGFLTGAALDMPEAFGMVREICARNSIEGAPLPYSFRCVAFQLIKGSFKGAKRRGAPIADDFVKRYLIYESALYLRDAFHFDLTRNEMSAQISACDVMVDVSAAFRMELKYELVRDWCTSKKYKDFRRRSEYFTDYFKGLALREFGVLKHAPLFGPIQEFLRMRDCK